MVDAVSGRRTQLRELFTEMISAFGSKEFDHFATFLRHDTVFEWPYLPLEDFPDRMIGVEAFVATSRAGMAECDPYRHQVDCFYDQLDPDMLIVEYHSDTIHRPSGRRYANKYLGILRYEDDKVVYWREYVNPLPILDVYGDRFRNPALESTSLEV